MGTALNKILKDIVIRYRTMAGYRSPFVPGWDCHGLPVEYKVIKNAGDIPASEVRKRCRAFATDYKKRMERQFRRLGVMGDWESSYSTMDPSCEAEQLRAFAAMVDRGLIFQARKPVHWSVGAQTALAEFEIEYKEIESPAIYVPFELQNGAGYASCDIVIWTTTPWTLPANQAVAVDPEAEYGIWRLRRQKESAEHRLVLAADRIGAFCAATGYRVVGGARNPLERFKGSKLVGKVVGHPLLDRLVPILPADFVTMDAGSGVVHIAPGHGEDDYRLGSAHDLPVLSPVDDAGTFTEECGIEGLVGIDVFAANSRIVSLLKQEDRLLGVGKWKHDYPHCWRSKTPLVFRAIKQFFVRLDDIRGVALQYADSVNWHPAWARNRIRGTISSRPDWCISRQRAWGVPLPVFYDSSDRPVLRSDWIRRVADLVDRHGSDIWFDTADPEFNRMLGIPEGLRRREDTMDVWMDSGFSHRAVPHQNQDLEFPADLYLEATDQHRGWYQSSLLTAAALSAGPPFRNCVTHGWVLNASSGKMSKSGQGALVERYVKRYGADVMRLWVSSVRYTEDVRFSDLMLERVVDAYRKFRNTFRILLGNLNDFELERDGVETESMTLVDRWILYRLKHVIEACREGYENYEYRDVFISLRDFCNVELSNVFIDVTKDPLYCDASESLRRRSTQTAIYHTLSSIARLAAPILPFTTEEVWSHFRPGRSIHRELLPEPDEFDGFGEVEKCIDLLLRLRTLLARELESARQDGSIGDSLEARVDIEISEASEFEMLQLIGDQLEEFLIVSEAEVHRGTVEKVSVSVSPHPKCERCWRCHPSVGKDSLRPDLCLRCALVVSQRNEG